MTLGTECSLWALVLSRLGEEAIFRIHLILKYEVGCLSAPARGMEWEF